MSGRLLEAGQVGRAVRFIGWADRPALGRVARVGIRVGLWAAGFALLAAYRLLMTTGAFRNSDDSGNFLAGIDMAEGNWRLHGWVMAPDNYYTTDVLGQAVLKLLFGYHPIFMQGLEALIWAGIALLGTALACRGAGLRHLPGTICIALSLLAFNVFEHQFRDLFMSSVASHGFTILLTLATFALATGESGSRRRAIARLVLLGCVILAGSFADPIFNVIACLPVLVVSLLGLRRGRWRRPATMIGVTIGAVVLARVLLVVNAHNGGFHSVGLWIALADYQQVLSHLGFAAASIARLMGMEFFGRVLHAPLVQGPWIYLLRAPLLLALVIAMWEVGRGLLPRVRTWPAAVEVPGHDDLELLLWLSLVLCVVSTCVTTVIVSETSARFFCPRRSPDRFWWRAGSAGFRWWRLTAAW